mgnify:CR=1 FL=1
MKALRLGLATLLAATVMGSANAASIGLSTNYSLDWAVSIATDEGSGITYNWDTNELWVIGDEGRWGRYSAANGAALAALPALNGYADPEGIAYLGGGNFAIAQERVMEINKIVGLAPVAEASAPSFDVNGPAGPVGNIGLEGISYDTRNGDFYGIKQEGPQAVYRMTGVNFAGGGTVTELFNPALLGLSSLSDITVLSNSTAFAGSGAEDNLLILSYPDAKLIEVTKAGAVLSALDLNGYSVRQIEGVTVDNAGNIFLVGEIGPGQTGSGGPSGILKFARAGGAGAVPEPATWAMMIGGFALAGSTLRRRKLAVRFA